MQLVWSLLLRLSKFPRSLFENLLIEGDSSRTSADIAHEFGWKPVKTEKDFQKNIFEEAKAIVEQK